MKYTNIGSYSIAIANGMQKVKEYPDPKILFLMPMLSHVKSGKK